jgi:hypothetical protein
VGNDAELELSVLESDGSQNFILSSPEDLDTSLSLADRRNGSCAFTSTVSMKVFFTMA